MAFVICATWTARTGEEDAVARAICELEVETSREPGNRLYIGHRSEGDPAVFFLYENYVDRDAFEAHLASDHFRRLALEYAIPRLESRARTAYITLGDDADHAESDESQK